MPKHSTRSGPYKVTKHSGAGQRSGPTLYQKFSSERMVDVNKSSSIHPYGGGSMQGFREGRMRPKGGPTQSEFRRVKR